jgi:hypothetical protein
MPIDSQNNTAIAHFLTIKIEFVTQQEFYIYFIYFL